MRSIADIARAVAAEPMKHDAADLQRLARAYLELLAREEQRAREIAETSRYRATGLEPT
jgi:hypothetical protein